MSKANGPYIPERFLAVELSAAPEWNPETKKYWGEHRALKRLEGIDANFVVTKFRGAVRSKATISIANLKREDVEFFTSFAPQWINYLMHRRITLFAGYKDKNVSKIFDGDILTALPTQPPDVWLECEALSGYYNSLNISATGIKGPVVLKNICTKAAELLNLKLDYRATENRSIDNFYHNGALSSIIEAINELGGIVAYEEDGTLIVENEEPPDPLNSVKVPLFTQENGLIGIPRPNPMGVNFTVLLDPSIKPGQAVDIESKAIPACSGRYYVYCVTHRGSLRGTVFYTELDCKRYIR